MAKLPDHLMIDFAEALTGEVKEKSKDSFVYGTVASSGEDGVSVIFDGAEVATPVSTTVDVEEGHRVLMLLKNHTATVVSNITSPTVNGVTFTNFRDGVLASFDGITAKYADLGGFISVSGDTGCAAKTTQNGGHAYPTSLYVQNSDNTYEYESGMKGDSGSSGNLAFYIKRMTKGGAWSSAINMFYVRNDGRLYAQDAIIKGEVEATAFKATSKVTDGFGTHTLTMQLDAGRLTFRDTAHSGIGVNITGYNVGSWASDTHYAQLSNGDLFIKNGNGAGTFSGQNVEVSFADGKYNRECRMTASSAGNAGLYDPDNSTWIIRSASNRNVYIPHPTSMTSVETYSGYYKPVGSYGTDGRRVAYMSARIDGSNYQFRVSGQWGDTGDNYSVKTIWSASTSDIRLKENIKPTDVVGLKAVNKMLVRQFDWKRDGRHQDIGFVADELEAIDPNLALGGGYDEDGNMDEKQVNTYQVVAYLVKAVQELSAQVHELKGDDDGR